MHGGLIPSWRRRPGACQSGRANDVWDMRDTFFDDFWANSFFAPFFGWNGEIKTDVSENDKEYVIEAELPGVKKEDIKVDLKDDILTISVENNQVINEEGKNYIRKERRYGSQSRNYYLNNVNEAGVTAKFDNGILTLTLPKAQGATDNRKRIDIQ